MSIILNGTSGITSPAIDLTTPLCHAGSCIIRKEGKEKIINNSTGAINLKANQWHEIEALEDNTIFVNIFRTNDY